MSVSEVKKLTRIFPEFRNPQRVLEELAGLNRRVKGLPLEFTAFVDAANSQIWRRPGASSKSRGAVYAGTFRMAAKVLGRDTNETPALRPGLFHLHTHPYPALASQSDYAGNFYSPTGKSFILHPQYDVLTAHQTPPDRLEQSY